MTDGNAQGCALEDAENVARESLIRQEREDAEGAMLALADIAGGWSADPAKDALARGIGAIAERAFRAGHATATGPDGEGHPPPLMAASAIGMLCAEAAHGGYGATLAASILCEMIGELEGKADERAVAVLHVACCGANAADCADGWYIEEEPA